MRSGKQIGRQSAIGSELSCWCSGVSRCRHGDSWHHPFGSTDGLPMRTRYVTMWASSHLLRTTHPQNNGVKIYSNAMDLFRAISETIDSVLTCDFFDSFKKFKMPDTKLMDTEPGGESTQ